MRKRKQDKLVEDPCYPNNDRYREMLAEVNEEAKLCDGLDEALIGVGYTFGKEPVAIYDIDKILDIYVKRDNMSYEEAQEFFDYNVLGCYVGEHMPMFINIY